MDQSEEAAFTIVENWWKRSFDISKNTGDPLFSLFTKSFETIMVYMSQSLDYEYIEREISSLDKDRQLAIKSEKSYDAHRCLSFGLIEAVQMMMKKNTTKLEEMIKKGYIPVPEIPKFPLEPKEEEITGDLELIPDENEISSPSLPQEIIVQPTDYFPQGFPTDDQVTPQATIEQNFQLKEEEIIDNDVITGMDDFAPEFNNSLNESENEILDQPRGIIAEEIDQISNVAKDDDETMNDNDEQSLNLTGNEGRKSTRRISRPAKYNSMEDSDEEEVEPTMKKIRLDSEKKSGEDSSQVKCVLCETYPTTAYGYAVHLRNVHKTTLNTNGIYLLCSCSFKIGSLTGSYRHSKECNSRQFTLHKTEDEVHSTPQCIMCQTHPKTALGYADHLRNVHTSTLNANGIYLLCSCGLKVLSKRGGCKHSKECDEREYSLHKVIEE